MRSSTKEEEKKTSRKTYTIDPIYVLVMKKNTSILMINNIDKSSRFSWFFICIELEKLIVHLISCNCLKLKKSWKRNIYERNVARDLKKITTIGQQKEGKKKTKTFLSYLFNKFVNQLV